MVHCVSLAQLTLGEVVISAIGDTYKVNDRGPSIEVVQAEQ